MVCMAFLSTGKGKKHVHFGTLTKSTVCVEGSSNHTKTVSQRLHPLALASSLSSLVFQCLLLRLPRVLQ